MSRRWLMEGLLDRTIFRDCLFNGVPEKFVTVWTTLHTNISGRLQAHKHLSIVTRNQRDQTRFPNISTLLSILGVNFVSVFSKMPVIFLAKHDLMAYNWGVLRFSIMGSEGSFWGFIPKNELTFDIQPFYLLLLFPTLESLVVLIYGTKNIGRVCTEAHWVVD